MDVIESSIPEAEAEAAECDLSVPIPRGGPIYVSNMVGSITRVPLFQDSLLSQLQVSLSLYFLSLNPPLFLLISAVSSLLFMQNLEAELCQDSSRHDVDLSYALFLLPLYCNSFFMPSYLSLSLLTN